MLKQLTEHVDLFGRLADLLPEVAAAAQCIAQTMRTGGRLLLCGNGGSAADCQHIAAEFVGRFHVDRPPLSAIALTTDSSALTAIANDFDFDEVFRRQVIALGRPGDVLLAISTSGRSENVRRAVLAAHATRMLTIGLLGGDGGTIGPVCDLAITVPSISTARVQEAHIFIGHVLCGMVEQTLEIK